MPQSGPPETGPNSTSAPASPSRTNPIQLPKLPAPNRSNLPRLPWARFDETGLRPYGLLRFLIPSADLIPLFYAALLFLTGIVLAHVVYLRPGLLLISLLPLAAFTFLTILKAPRLQWLPIAAIWLILGTWSAETEPSPAPSPTLLQLSDGLLRTVEGTVTEAGPLRAENPSESEDEGPENAQNIQQIDLQIASAEAVTDSSDTMLAIPQTETPRIRLLVHWPQATPPLFQCGEHLRAVVRFLPPDTFHDPGVWDRAAYLETQQITATGKLTATQHDSKEPRLTRLTSAPPSPTSTTCLLNHMRNAATARLQSLPSITRTLPKSLRATPEDAAMLTALLTGDRTYLTRNLRAGFERTGSFHLIVVSGLHLAILAGCILALCRKLHLPRIPATLLTIAATLAYALFTGFAIPAQRSFWMITLYLIGRLLYRDRSPLNVIGFATLCIAAVSPRSIFDASLQMTILAVAAIAGIALPLLDRTLRARVSATKDLPLIALDVKLPPKIAQFRVTLRLLARHLERATNHRIAWKLLPLAIRSALRLGELIFITLVVELALALPMAMYFHRITVYALPVNLLILPLLGLLVPVAMLTLLALAIAPPIAALPAALCLAILHLSLAIVRILGTLSWSDLRIPDPTALQIALTILLFILAILLTRTAGPPRRLAFATLLLAAISSLWPRPIQHPDNALLFQAIDVGQGDSLLLITPDGKTLLIDAGGLGFPTNTTSTASPQPAAQPKSQFDIGEEVVSAVLWSRGIRHLNAVALTHAHQDHMGGMAAILRNFHPKELWVGNNPPVAAYKALLAEAAKLNIQLHQFHAGDTTTLGAVSLRVLAPAVNYQPGPEPANNDSLVLQARYGATSILLEGDAEAPEENALLARTILTEPELASNILKVGHHGSLTSTRPEFLAAVHPAYAVISCGRRNRFGHPRPEILTELQASQTRTFRTDITGTVCFELDGKSVTPQPMCGNQP